MLSINNGYTSAKTPTFAAKQQIHVDFKESGLSVKTKDRMIKDAMEPLRQLIIEKQNSERSPWDHLAHNPCTKADIRYVRKDGLSYPYFVSGQHLKELDKVTEVQQYLEFPSEDKDVHVIFDPNVPIFDQVEVGEDPKTDELILKGKKPVVH